MRTPGIRLHKLALFGWAVVITAVLLLLSLPVLAGKQILPALNLSNCWEKFYCLTLSAATLISVHYYLFFIDYNTKFMCYKFYYSTLTNELNYYELAQLNNHQASLKLTSSSAANIGRNLSSIYVPRSSHIFHYYYYLYFPMYKKINYYFPANMFHIRWLCLHNLVKTFFNFKLI